jgi:hypothetical protein
LTRTHVVVDDVESAVLPHDLLVHRLYPRLVSQVGLHRELADAVVDLVDADHHAALAREPPGDRLTDHARGPFTTQTLPASRGNGSSRPLESSYLTDEPIEAAYQPRWHPSQGPTPWLAY